MTDKLGAIALTRTVATREPSRVSPSRPVGRVSTIAALIDDPAGQATFMLPRLDEAQREMIVRLKPKRAWQRVSERDFDRVWPGIRTGAEWPDQFWFAGGHAHYPAGRKPLGKKRCSYGFSLNEAGLILRSLLLASGDRSPEGEKPQALNAKHESAVPSEASADAPPPAPSLQTPQGGDS